MFKIDIYIYFMFFNPRKIIQSIYIDEYVKNDYPCHLATIFS